MSLRGPTVEELDDISHKCGFACTAEELEVYRTLISESEIPAYDLLDQLPDITLPVKYPRTAGSAPLPGENKHNAWAWICDITGAQQGLLHGKRIALKDNIALSGVPLTNGSRIFDGYVPEFDATVVTRILDEGGKIVGKSNCEGLCISGASYNLKNGPVTNPHNEKHSAGGSSSGSAVVVQQGEADMALGGDQGGSIRIPASNCGIVGIKPTFGLVPYSGIFPIETCIDHVGPMAKTVEGCALLLQAIASYDGGRDPRQVDIRELYSVDYVSEIKKPSQDLKIAVIPEGFTLCDQVVQDVIRAAVSKIEKSGKFAAVKDVSIPIHADGYGTGYKGIQPTSMVDAFYRGFKTHANDVHPPTKMIHLLSRYIRDRYGNHFYSKSQNYSTKICEAYNQALKDYDVLLMPTLPHPPCELPTSETSFKDALINSLNEIPNTCPFNATGHPALSLNGGWDKGLPIGLMLVGRKFDDKTVLRAAKCVEDILK